MSWLKKYQLPEYQIMGTVPFAPLAAPTPEPKTPAFTQNNLKDRMRAFKTIRPSEDTDIKNYLRWATNVTRSQFDEPRSEEAWRIYLGVPGPNQYFSSSKVRPAYGDNPSKNYYKVDDQLEQDIFNTLKDEMKPGESRIVDESEINSTWGPYDNVTSDGYLIIQPGDENLIFGRPSKSRARALGHFTVNRGTDANGDYLSYQDVYDFPDWIQNRTKGVPFDVYNRIYYPKPDKKQKKKDGGWLDIYQEKGLVIPGVTDFKMPLNRIDVIGRTEPERITEEATADEINRRNRATNKRQFISQGQASTPYSEAKRIMLNRQNTAGLPNVQMDESGTTSRINPNISYTGEPENFMGERQQKGVEHLLGALEATGYVTGAGELAGAGYNAVKKALAESMESGLLSKTYKLNPWAFKANPEAYYRGIGRTGLDDALESGVLRSNRKGNFGNDLYLSSSFDEADYYANNKLPWTIREDGKVVDDLVKGKGIDTNKYFAEVPKQNINVTPHHINDTQFISKDVIPIDKVKLLQKDWLRGYKEVPKPTSEILPPPQQSGFTWAFNPLSYFGEKLPEGWHRKMGSGKGIQSIIENKGIVSPTNDYLFFSEGNSPVESYPGVFSTSYSSERIPNKSVSGWNRFYGPRGRHKGLTPIDLQGNPIENISLEDPALNVHRRVPFTNAYVTIPKEVLINGPRTFREKVLTNPIGANVQKYAEDLTKLGIYGSIGQYMGNSIYGNEENPTPLGEPVLPMLLRKGNSLDDAIIKKLKSQKKEGGWLDEYAEGGQPPVNPNGMYDGIRDWRIPGGNITMQGVPFPVLAKASNGMTTIMQPGGEYNFPGAKHVDEYPIYKFGGSELKNGGWLNNYK